MNAENLTKYKARIRSAVQLILTWPIPGDREDEGRMDAIKKKMQAMKVEKDNALDR